VTLLLGHLRHHHEASSIILYAAVLSAPLRKRNRQSNASTIASSLNHMVLITCQARAPDASPHSPSSPQAPHGTYMREERISFQLSGRVTSIHSASATVRRPRGFRNCCSVLISILVPCFATLPPETPLLLTFWNPDRGVKFISPHD
jgi:hypothetical protein